jgi:betaine reductase
VKIVHYINQFFAGLGGEEQAGTGPQSRPGPVGPGRRLASLLGDEHEIVATVFCGDDYAASNEDAATEIVELIKEAGAEMVVAGPAFTSGRYGIACGRVANEAHKAGLTALAIMHKDNPGVGDAAPAPVVASGMTAREMGKTLQSAAEAIAKFAAGEKLTAADGLVGTAPRTNRTVAKNAATRAVDLALAWLGGDKQATEIPAPDFGKVTPATPIEDPSQALIAILTEGGLVPAGNPGKLESARASKWLRYPLADVQQLEKDSYQSIHGGFSTAAANADPHRILPLDVARELESEGKIGRLYAEYFVTTGNGTPVGDGARYGVQWAAELHKAGVQAAILTAT